MCFPGGHHCGRLGLKPLGSSEKPHRMDLGFSTQKVRRGCFPGGTVVKNTPANAGDTGSMPGPGRSHMPWSN